MSQALEVIQVSAEKILDRGRGGRYQHLQDLERGTVLHQVRIRFVHFGKCLRLLEIGAF